MAIEITCIPYGTTKSGDRIDQFLLSNNSGLEVGIINYGGIISTLRVPDRNGDIDDVVLGYDSLSGYEDCAVHFGCITGPFANRINNGQFTIDGQRYQLETNRGQHHLHGASAGLGKAVWLAEAKSESGSAAVVLRYVSVDGLGGYPGDVQFEVVYRLTEGNQLQIEYRAVTDKPTIINLTNHSYFNLKGHQHAVTDGVLDHQLQLLADSFVPTDDVGIPLGGLRSVEGTPLDFRQTSRIGERIQDPNDQLANGRGYDHNWVASEPGVGLKLVASVTEQASGRKMDIETTQPGVQFYSGNNLKDHPGRDGVRYGFRGALCLETQHFPDSPNHEDFPETVLRPDEEWAERANFRFSVLDN